MTISAQSTTHIRRIASATLIVMVFFVLSRVTGLLREMIVAAQFGASAELDAYLAAFRVPDLLFQLVAGGALGSAFIPTFAGHWVKQDQAGAWLLFSRVLNLITLILIGLAGLAALFALPLMQHLIAPGFSPAQQQLAAGLMRWMLISTVIFGASGLIMGALNATQHFLLPAAAPVLYNVAIMAGAWFLAPTFGVRGMVIGVVVGAFAHLLVQVPGLWGRGARYTPSLTVSDPGVQEVMRLMGPRVLGLFFVQLHFLVNTILASGLDEGRLAALNYAWMLMLLPQGVFAQAIATAIFPTFAAQIAAGDPKSMQRTFGQTLRTVLFLTLPAAVGLFVLRQPLVAMLFQRRQFSAEDTQLVGYALQFYAIGLTAHSLLEIVVRAFYALHDTWTPVVVGVASMVANILLSLLLVRPLEHGGLALANSSATMIEMLFLLWLLRRRMGGIDERKLWKSLLKSGIAALGMGLLVGLWLRLVPMFAMGNLTLWAAGIGGMGVAVLAYFLISALLKSEELRPALQAVLRKR
ncbi:MAG: murein biosynthesis integral membrane protein MurJ [Caldilineaceae bacterium]